MEDKLKQYVDRVFAEAPNTRQAVDLKEEILQNTLERYRDLLAEGKNEETAYRLAADGIGDVSDLLRTLWAEAGETAKREAQTYNDYGQAGSGYGPQHEQTQQIQEEIKRRQGRSALLTSIAIMLYISCVVPCILLSGTNLENNLGPCLMFLMIATATGLLIYNAKTRIKGGQMEHWQGGQAGSQTEWQPGEQSGERPTNGGPNDYASYKIKEQRAARKGVSGAVWSLGVAVYLILSFITMAWHVTWLVFLITLAVNNILKACFDLKGWGVK